MCIIFVKFVTIWSKYALRTQLLHFECLYLFIIMYSSDWQRYSAPGVQNCSRETVLLHIRYDEAARWQIAGTYYVPWETVRQTGIANIESEILSEKTGKSLGRTPQAAGEGLRTETDWRLRKEDWPRLAQVGGGLSRGPAPPTLGAPLPRIQNSKSAILLDTRQGVWSFAFYWAFNLSGRSKRNN